MKQLLAFTAAAVAASVPAFAFAQPNANAAPISGEITLSSGFTGDPRIIAVTAGGANNAARTANGCAGFISDRPDVRLNFRNTGSSLPLIISVGAVGDTTLVINGPDGRWYCDDDGGNADNPSVRIARPATGRYEIWIGTYASGHSEAARLHISELTSQ
jgi:hypothetical protein